MVALRKGLDAPRSNSTVLGSSEDILKRGTSTGFAATFGLLIVAAHFLDQTPRRPVSSGGHFQGGSSPKMRDFRQKVREVLDREYPGIERADGPEDHSLVVRGSTVFLDNIFRQTQGLDSEEERSQAIRAFLASILPPAEALVERAIPISFQEAGPLLRLQLIPVSLVDFLASRSRDGGTSMVPAVDIVAGELRRAIVIDEPSSYAYVTQGDVRRWGRPFAEVVELASANSHAASTGSEWSGATTGSWRFLSTSSDDAYEAARILLPEIRSFLGSHLGEPFYFAVPHRGMLFAWSRDSPASQKAKVLSWVATAYSEYSHPVSGSIYLATRSEVSEAPRSP